MPPARGPIGVWRYHRPDDFAIALKARFLLTRFEVMHHHPAATVRDLRRFACLMAWSLSAVGIAPDRSVCVARSER